MSKQLLLIMTVAALLYSMPAAATAAPEVTGKRPPATAPFAHDDSTPRLTLEPHCKPQTARQVAETFLAYLAAGFHPSVEAHSGGTIMGGEPRGYEKAWEYVAPEGPDFNAFMNRWEGTLRSRIIQLEPMDRPGRFFVEFQRVGWSRDYWGFSYWIADLHLSETPSGWRVVRFEIFPQNMVNPNIAGHGGWWQSEVSLAMTLATDPQAWEAVSLTYERRTVRILLRHKHTGEEKRFRMARTLEGTWVPLEPARGSVRHR